VALIWEKKKKRGGRRGGRGYLQEDNTSPKWKNRPLMGKLEQQLTVQKLKKGPVSFVKGGGIRAVTTMLEPRKKKGKRGGKNEYSDLLNKECGKGELLVINGYSVGGRG